jgi:hypothetical protein
MECLSVKGNVLIERHPDYKSLLVQFFPNLRSLDSENIYISNDQDLQIRDNN